MCDRYRYGENGLSGAECLIADIGPCPPGMTLGRIDNDLGYLVGNVRWETAQEQANNSRHNTVWTIDERTQTSAQWIREFGWPVWRLYNKAASLKTLLSRIMRTAPPPTTESDPAALTEASLRNAGFVRCLDGVWRPWDDLEGAS
jgi:hypothetical protein